MAHFCQLAGLSIETVDETLMFRRKEGGHGYDDSVLALRFLQFLGLLGAEIEK